MMRQRVAVRHADASGGDITEKPARREKNESLEKEDQRQRVDKIS